MQGRREIADLTSVRALFALWVLAYHIDLHAGFSAALGPGANLLRRGYLGVDGFFILSGFILATTNQPAAPRRGLVLGFYGRRLARLYPLHIATILLLAGLYGAGRAAGIAANDPARFAAGALGAHLLLVQGWGAVNHWAWNYPSWSISTECAGYLVFPWLWRGIALLPFEIAATLLIALVPVLGLIAYLSASQLNLTFALSLIRFFPEFCAGLILARVVGPAAALMPARVALLPAGGLVLVGVIAGYDVVVVAGLGLGLLGLAMRDQAGWGPCLPQPLKALGALSYALYMSFAPAELVVAQAFRHAGIDPAGSRILFALAMAGLTLALGYGLHVMIERPARDFFAARLVAKPLAV